MRAGTKFPIPGKHFKPLRYDYYAIFFGKLQLTDWNNAPCYAWQEYYVRGDQSLPMKLQLVCKMLSYDKQEILNKARYLARMQAQRNCVL